MLRLALPIAALLAAPALAQDVPWCMPRAAMLEIIASHDETQQSLGVSEVGVVEVYANPATGTWTIITTDTAGTACFLSHGEAWHGGFAAPAGAPA